tara:strand:- start:1238 stop:2182 length:945 start_codon:yes stop_codon:yes gene_type:complete
MDMPLKCKICEKEFKKNSGLHIHIKRGHKTELKSYYKKFYPKKSKLYGKTIPFKSAEDYIKKDFISREELIEWCSKENPEIVKPYIEELLVSRKESKGLKYALSEIELELCNFPNIDSYKNVFGSYTKLCKKINLNCFLNKKIPDDFFIDKQEEKDLKIFVDTREQKPIKFKNSDAMKLDFGDYTVGGEMYDYTYVDRKSEGDFKSTLSGDNYERFKRELERARKFDSYIFIIIESSIEKIKLNNNFGAHKSKLPYIWHNLKQMSQDYRDVCQFIFAHNRAGLKKIIPKILLNGKKLWNVDVQYFINKKINEKS